MTDERLDALLHQVLAPIEPNDMLNQSLLERVRTSLVIQPQSLYRRRKIWYIVVACLAILMTGCTILGLLRNVAVTVDESYEKYEELQLGEKIFGYKIRRVEKFQNDYAYAGGDLLNVAGADEEQKTLFELKALELQYEKDRQLLRLCVENKELYEKKFGISFEETAKSQAMEILAIKGIKVYYQGYTRKHVPEGYELNHFDVMNQKNGKYEVIYDADHIYMQYRYEVVWEQDGLVYTLGNRFSDDVSANELFEMAEELINLPMNY